MAGDGEGENGGGKETEETGWVVWAGERRQKEAMISGTWFCNIKKVDSSLLHTPL